MSKHVTNSLLDRNTYARKNFRIHVSDDDVHIALTFKAGLEQNLFVVDAFNNPV